MENTIYHNTSGNSASHMGLSNITILQQSEFFNSLCSRFFMRRVGQSVIFFKSSVKGPKHKVVTEKHLAMLESQRFTGYLSRPVQKKMISMIQNWDDTLQEMNARNMRNNVKERYQIILLTVTLSSSQQHDDKFIKRWLLTPFIGKLVRLNPDVNYLWRAEPQKNGNIHFHILLDRYFNKSWVQREWNKTQSQHSYHPSLTENENDLGAPSTRIEALASKNNAVQYCAKYVSKNEGSRAIDGRLWGCSDNLRDLKPIEYSLSKNECIEVIKSISDNPVNMWQSDYGIKINYPHDWALIQNSLRLNFSADMALAYNVDKLFTRSLNPIFALKQTTWFNELNAELGLINVCYLEAQTSLFPTGMV